MTIGSQTSDHRTYVEKTRNGIGTGYYLYQGSLWSKSWSGVDALPNENPLGEHNYTMSMLESDYPVIELTRYQTNPPYGVDSIETILATQFGVPGFLGSSWTSNDDLKVLTKMANKVAGSDFHSGNFVAQLGQTTELIADTAKRIAMMLHYIREGNLMKAASSVVNSKRFNNVSGRNRNLGVFANQRNLKKIVTPADVSNAILELHFGWQPLLSDVDAAMEATVARAEVPYLQRHTVRRRKVDVGLVSTGIVDWSVKTVRTRELRSVFSAPLSLSTQFRLNDPLSALVEVTPWSFVVDWAWPISDYLKALHYLRNFNISSAWATNMTVSTAVLKGSNSSTYAVSSNPMSFRKSVSVSRSPFMYDTGSLPLPSLKPIDKIVSLRHLTDSIALLTQRASAFGRY